MGNIMKTFVSNRLFSIPFTPKERLGVVTILCAICQSLTTGAWAAEPVAGSFKITPNQDWQPIDLSDLSIKPGTALDFSFLVEKGKAGQHGFLQINAKGQFVFEKRPEVPVRFYCAPGLPGGKGEIPFGNVETLAEQIRLAGYNSIRAHFLDDFLMTGSKVEGEFNPQMVVRWERFTAALKQRGIYLVIDASTSWSAFTTTGAWEKGARDVRMKTRLYYDPKARELWMKGVRQLFEHVNPYTGMALKDDPQVLWVAMRNEATLNFQMIPSKFDPGMVKPFREWLKKRYSTREAWAAAWGAALGANVTFETVELPKLAQTGPVGADLQRFFTDIEQETWFWGVAFLRGIGLKCLLNDYNFGASMQDIIARDVLPFVDNHVYHDHNTAYVSPGSEMECDNAIQRQNPSIRWISPARALGRPFTITEWGGYFWNPYRYYEGPLFAAYAALQDWQLLAQHTDPVIPSLAATPGDKAPYILPVRVGKDPAAKANDRMAAFLFARGDVMPSPHRVEIRLDANTLYGRLDAKRSISASLTPLALLSGFGSRVVEGKKSAPLAPYTPDLVITPESGTAVKMVDGAELTTAAGVAANTEKLVAQLRQKGVLEKGNRTDISKQVFESDTRQLLLDARQRSFAINTPRSQGVCLPAGPFKVSVGEIEVENKGACLSLMLASLSEAPIASSKRLLLILSGNALNRDMTFKDSSMKTLVSIGKGPALVRLLQLQLSARLEEPGSFEVWALAQNGTRLEKIPCAVKDGALSIPIDTGKLSNGPSQYFEFIRAGK